jgi:predicted amidohydrolase YtcJ
LGIALVERCLFEKQEDILLYPLVMVLDGVVLGSDQRITPLEALKAITINGTYQYGEQANKGSIEAGKLADLVILDKDPLTVPPMAIKDINVVETIKEGKTVYKASLPCHSLYPCRSRLQ